MRAWRVQRIAGRYYAEYTTDDGESWTPTPPGGFDTIGAAIELAVEMRRKDKGEEVALTEDEKLALLEKFGGREDELHDDMVNLDAERAQRLLEWGKYLVDRGIVNESLREGASEGEDDGQLRAGMAS